MSDELKRLTHLERRMTVPMVMEWAPQEARWVEVVETYEHCEAKDAQVYVMPERLGPMYPMRVASRRVVRVVPR